MLGINELADKALEHETAAKEGRAEDIEKGYEALMKLYQDYVLVINEALSKLI
jgi:hypothetical protein